MRVLSPRIDPPERVLDGSMASTATRWPRARRRIPIASTKVLLPTPGTPVIPTRRALPVAGRRRPRSSCAERRVRFLPALDQRDGLREDGAVLARARRAHSHRA